MALSHGLLRPVSTCQPIPLQSPTRKQRFQSAFRTVTHHVKRHVGVGIICAVGYFDPGNWSVDLQAGSSFGYRPMLFVLLMAALIAIVLQTLSSKLGCVTGLDLASHCRLLLHDHPRHPRLVRRLVLYPLYVLCEIAIMSTDLAELLGSAIGLSLIFPKLPIWASVVVTAADVLVFLALGDPSRGHGRPVRLFEFTIIVLVFAVFGCFVALLFKVHPNWPQVFLGFIPDKSLFQTQPDAVYTAIGILGATVMPHGLFLGSSLATQDRVSPAPEHLPSPAAAASDSIIRPNLCAFLWSWATSLFRVSRAHRDATGADYRSKHGQRENNSLDFIDAHLRHGVADVVLSLLCVAVPINSAILILAGTVFAASMTAPAGLFDAHDLIKEQIGAPAALVFAIALLFAGQTSSVTATYAGQIVSEGFIEWRISPFLRRLITRLLGLIPSVIVAVAIGQQGLNTMLVASQVVLSVVLPFVAFPLIYLTSSETVMRVRKASPPAITNHMIADDLPSLEVPSVELLGPAEKEKIDKIDKVKEDGVTSILDETIDYSNGWILKVVCYAIWGFVLIANFYAIVMLAMGKTGQ